MKKTERNKEKGFIWAVCILGIAFLVLLFLNIFFGDHWLDSDMAAEMIFSKQIAEEGGYFTTPNWYYSTEFRLLYTQLFMVPLFHIFEDWHVIRVITNVITYLLLLGSYYYFMKPLKVNRTLVVLSSVILLLPFSETFVTHMQMGNTYMPHVIIVFFCFGMFLRLVQQKKLLEKQNILLLAAYTSLSIVCGMSGVRYMLALQVPLVLTAVYFVFCSKAFTKLREEFSKENLKTVCGGEGILLLLYSIYGAFFALVGYVINVAVIARNFPFQTYEATNFIKIFQGVLLERLQDTAGNLLMLFGYIEEKGFLSLRGLISMIAFALLAGIVLLVKRVNAIEEKKGKEPDLRSFIRYFFVIAFILNTFVFVFTTSTIVSRYYITVFIFVLPLICFYYELEERCLDRYLVLLFLCGCLGLGTVKCVYSFVDKDKNAEEKKVAAFLEAEGYSFGYASYWNANIMTELSDGVLEVANIGDFETMSYFRWSSPMKYYETDYHQGKTFLLMTGEQREEYSDLKVLKNGKQIYADDTYVVFHYDSVQEVFADS